MKNLKCPKFSKIFEFYYILSKNLSKKCPKILKSIEENQVGGLQRPKITSFKKAFPLKWERWCRDPLSITFDLLYLTLIFLNVSDM